MLLGIEIYSGDQYIQLVTTPQSVFEGGAPRLKLFRSLELMFIHVVWHLVTHTWSLT